MSLATRIQSQRPVENTQFSSSAPSSQHQKGQMGVLRLRDGIRKRNKLYLVTQTYIQPTTSWLVHFLEHPWCQDEPWVTLDSQNSPQPGLGGSQHLPPYSILYITPPHLHSNGTFSRDSQGGVPKLSQFGLSGFWQLITPCSNPRLG